VTEDVALDYTTWDWIPGAAGEMQSYVERLLQEAGIRAHDVAARVKSIASAQRKQAFKRYASPMREMTDIVAVRIITYSNTDRARAGDLIRERFSVIDGEDRNPGDDKPERLRGYDCQHIVVSGQQSSIETDWLISGGSLSRFFDELGGIEVQIRTVAGHAWAEFEHARRYKGAQYGSIDEQDQETIDQLFGAASDARRALDEVFVAIDRILARPSVDESSTHLDESGVAPTGSRETDDTALTAENLATFLATRFPDDRPPSDSGIVFGLQLAAACGIDTMGALKAALEPIDSEQVLDLMDITTPVTSIRRFDDELLARFGEKYIRDTGALGQVRSRSQQLEWRFDRLRGKSRYKVYYIEGVDRPAHLPLRPLTATGVVRELAALIAREKSIECVTGLDAVSRFDDLPRGARGKPVDVRPGEVIWVSTNLNRDGSEELMRDLLALADGLDLRVERDGRTVAQTPDSIQS
jgi:ppGpp synthetase/RelA/SpoT-type nucleotidyltranferase